MNQDEKNIWTLILVLPPAKPCRNNVQEVSRHKFLPLACEISEYDQLQKHENPPEAKINRSLVAF